MKGARLAEGASAEIFAWGDDAVLKLFRPQYAYAVDIEVERARAVHRAGLPAPAVRDVVTVEERPGIVFARVDGPTLLAQVAAGQVSLEQGGERLADLHLRLHRTRGVAGLQAHDKRLGEIRARLPAHEHADLDARFALVPEGDAVYHGDFHPGNVIVSAQGPVVVDWPNAALAHPAFDVARSIVLMRYQSAPDAMAADPALRESRERLTHAYVGRYLAAGTITRAQVDACLPVHAQGILRAQAFEEADRATLEELASGAASSGNGQR